MDTIDAPSTVMSIGSLQERGKRSPAGNVSPGVERDHETSEVGAADPPAPLLPPCERAGIEVLPDGTIVRIEPLRRGDRAGVGRLFARLGPESRLRRFLSPKAALSERELAFLSDVGRVEHSAVAAIDVRDGSVVGIARYVEHEAQPGVADTAIAVADGLQHRGIGTVLMRRLIGCARANGFHRLTATTLWENRPARALMKRMGFQARASSGAEIELALELGVAGGAGAVADDPARG